MSVARRPRARASERAAGDGEAQGARSWRGLKKHELGFRLGFGVQELWDPSSGNLPHCHFGTYGCASRLGALMLFDSLAVSLAATW